MPAGAEVRTLSRIACRLWGSTPDGGLVEHEQRRVVQQARGDVEPAPHAAREGVDPVVAPVGEVDELEHLVDTLAERPPAQPVEAAEEVEVLASGEIGIERDVLGHVADALAAGRRSVSTSTSSTRDDARRVQQAAHHADRRGLPRAVRPEQPVRLTRRDVEAHVVDGDASPKWRVRCSHCSVTTEQRYRSVTLASVGKMLDGCIRTGEEQSLVAVVSSAQPRWPPVGAVDLEDLGVSIRLAHMVAFDHKTIANLCLHLRRSFVRVGLADWSRSVMVA